MYRQKETEKQYLSYKQMALRICKKGTQKVLMLPSCLYEESFFAVSFYHIQLKAIESTIGCFLLEGKGFLLR